MLILIGIAAAIVIVGYFVLRYYPAFGAAPTKEKRKQLSRSKYYAKDRFVNLIDTPTDQTAMEKLQILAQFIKGNSEGRPAAPLSIMPIDEAAMNSAVQPGVTWFGHSAALLQLDGKKLLLDPMFGSAPSPFPFVGGKRFSGRLPMELEQLPVIDAVFISHDHYDHLDFGSIVKLKEKVKQFFVPLGVGPHLERWGVKPSAIEEHDWWEEFEYEGLQLACTPARHFSGRSLTDRDATLWCSWVIKGQDGNVFFSGDSGYGPHFKDIGSKYGPFDLTLMECGQYDERWASIHMLPEETVKAHMDVKGKLLLPIHWGAFTLALHGWTEPVERALAEAKLWNIRVATPRIGEMVLLGSIDYPKDMWWRSL